MRLSTTSLTTAAVLFGTLVHSVPIPKDEAATTILSASNTSNESIANPDETGSFTIMSAKAPSSSSRAIPSASVGSALTPSPSSLPAGNSTSPSGNSTSGSGGDVLSFVLPPSSKSHWSMSPQAPDAAQLSDETFNIVQSTKSLKYEYAPAPDGQQSLKGHFAQGSYRIGAKDSPPGGFSFYAKGSQQVDLSTATEATFGYSVMFPEGFQFNKGGKLPGFYGGDDDEVATTCSGGDHNIKCFSSRLMWRTDGAGEVYTYLPPASAGAQFAPNAKQCDLPNSDCNDQFGNSLNRGAYKFVPGQWTRVMQRMKLNSERQADGEIELFVDGKSVTKVDGLVIASSAQGKMRGIQMQTFFGGNDQSWASPAEQDIYFADFSVAILA